MSPVEPVRCSAMTWETRDLPVLRAIVRLCDLHGDIGPETLARDTGLDEDTVQVALRALRAETPPFFRASVSAGDEVNWVDTPTGHARRAVGSWPQPGEWAEQVVTALTEIAEREPDEKERGKLRTAAAAFGGLSKSVIAEVTATVITRGAGLS